MSICPGELGAASHGYVPLTNVARIVTGSTPPTARRELYGGDLPFVKPTQLQNCAVTVGGDTLSGVGMQVADIAPANSILVTCIGNLGRAGLTTTAVAFNQQINAIIPFETGMAKWIFYAVQAAGFQEQLQTVASATTISIVN